MHPAGSGLIISEDNDRPLTLLSFGLNSALSFVTDILERARQAAGCCSFAAIGYPLARFRAPTAADINFRLLHFSGMSGMHGS
jgi:hypothetical protein